MSAKLWVCAASIGLSAACGSVHHDDVQTLQNRLEQAETAVKLSAENSRRLENTYSDIYFELNSLTVENFKDKVTRGETFYAYIGRPDCSDCNAFEPMFKRYIASYRLQSKIYFVNVRRLHQDKRAWAAFKQQYRLSGTPVLAKYSRGLLANKLDFEENRGINPTDLEKWLKLNKFQPHPTGLDADRI